MAREKARNVALAKLALLLLSIPPTDAFVNGKEKRSDDTPSPTMAYCHLRSLHPL